MLAGGKATCGAGTGMVAATGAGGDTLTDCGNVKCDDNIGLLVCDPSPNEL